MIIYETIKTSLNMCFNKNAMSSLYPIYPNLRFFHFLLLLHIGRPFDPPWRGEGAEAEEEVLNHVKREDHVHASDSHKKKPNPDPHISTFPIL